MIRSIRTQIFLSHLLLLVVVIACLSFYNYKQALDALTETTIVTRKASLAALLYEISDAVAGGNYANLQSPRISEEVNRQDGLLYMVVTGRTSQSGLPVKVIYSRLAGKLWRAHYPKGYEQQLDVREAGLIQRLNQSPDDSHKVEFLLDRISDARQGFSRNQRLSELHRQEINHYQGMGESVIDFERQQLYLTLPLGPGAKGQVEILFDTRILNEIKSHFVANAFREMLVGTLLALPVLWLLSSNIANPLNRLSSFLRQRDNLRHRLQIPGIQRPDEIGALALSFSELLDDLLEKNRELENLSRFDPLTGLLNRRSLSERVTEMADMQSDMLMSCFYMDVDYFKKFNDFYGHAAGDDALEQLAGVFKSCAEQLGGFAFRFGGEEFMLLLPLVNAEDAKAIAESLRTSVSDLAIPHVKGCSSGLLTLSIGIAVQEVSGVSPENIHGLIAQADNALYRAKERGRDRVEIVPFKEYQQVFSWEI